MSKQKTLIQRNLPLDRKYEILGSFYQSLEEGGCTCQNCDRVIANIAEVKDTVTGSVYYVGMDCAETLEGVKNDLEYNQHKFSFDAAKAARAKILKIKKEADAAGVKLAITAKTFEDEKNFFKEIGAGRYSIAPVDDRNISGYRYWKVYPKHQWERHVFPMIKNLLTEL